MASMNSRAGGAHNSSSAKTLFPSDISFQVETFSNKDFIVKDWLDDLSEKAFPSSRRTGQAQEAFDPKPLIRYFESKHILFLPLESMLTLQIL